MRYKFKKNYSLNGIRSSRGLLTIKTSGGYRIKLNIVFPAYQKRCVGANVGNSDAKDIMNEIRLILEKKGYKEEEILEGNNSKNCEKQQLR